MHRYIERCTMMWVLVPPTKHQDLGDDAMCDFNSWRKRGWCRMEYGAAQLKCVDDMPVMIVKACDAKMEYVNPCDTAKLVPFGGAFSVEDDRRKVVAVLDQMIRRRAESHISQASAAIGCGNPFYTATALLGPLPPLLCSS
jgi:hypothetical protein